MDEACDLLRELVAEVRLLRGDLAVSRRATELRQPDVDALTLLLPALWASIQARAFTVAELVEHAALPTEARLAAVLDAVGGTRAIGRLLSRGDGSEVAGVICRRVGRDNGGNVFAVAKVIQR